MASDSTPPLVWGLLGGRRGDNQQVLALGAALGWPFVAKRLRYTRPSRIPNLLRRSVPLGIHADPETPVAPPWPDLVIAVGRRSAPLALAIRKATHGRCRLVQLGRPSAPLSWFDLVVTTPQYQLPAAANVVALPLPFGGWTPTPAPAALPPSIPRMVALVGGPTAEIRFGAEEAHALVERVINAANASGARIDALTSPRTPPAVVTTLESRLPAPHEIHVWRKDEPNRYAELVAGADQIIVTGDSVSMLADACRSNAAIEVFALPEHPRALRRCIAATAARHSQRSGPLSRLMAAPLTLGLVPAPRRYAAVHDALSECGLLGVAACTPAARHAAIAAWESAALARVRALLART